MYASTVLVHREELWSYLKELGRNLSSDWFLLGAFSQQLNLKDKTWGAKFKYQQARKLGDVLESCDLTD